MKNNDILEAMEQASIRGRIASSLDAVARILEVDLTPEFQRQARNLATKTGDLGARRFIEGRTRRRY